MEDNKVPERESTPLGVDRARTQLDSAFLNMPIAVLGKAINRETTDLGIEIVRTGHEFIRVTTMLPSLKAEPTISDSSVEREVTVRDAVPFSARASCRGCLKTATRTRCSDDAIFRAIEKDIFHKISKMLANCELCQDSAGLYPLLQQRTEGCCGAFLMVLDHYDPTPYWSVYM